MSTQKVLGFNLAATSLPDAIAAMVEAWYEAQNVENQTVSTPSKDLIECIDYILNQSVNQETLGSIKNLGVNPTVKDLLIIRHGQGLGARSNAGFALSRLGINYKGYQSNEIRIINNAPVFSGLSKEQVNRYGRALFDAPGTEKITPYGNKLITELKMPSKHFTDRCLS
jgi:hypothetical protein